MNYAEAAYFEGNACQHVADWDERRRLARIADRGRELFRLKRLTTPHSSHT